MPFPSGAYQFDSRIGVNPHKHTAMQVGFVLLLYFMVWPTVRHLHLLVPAMILCGSAVGGRLHSSHKVSLLFSSLLCCCFHWKCA
jgi:hypothetical protein